MCEIRKLSPAAARLLLAFLSATPGESYDDVVIRSGITAYSTVVKAKQALSERGFLLRDSKGEEYVNFQANADA